MKYFLLLLFSTDDTKATVTFHFKMRKKKINIKYLVEAEQCVFFPILRSKGCHIDFGDCPIRRYLFLFFLSTVATSKIDYISEQLTSYEVLGNNTFSLEMQTPHT